MKEIVIKKKIKFSPSQLIFVFMGIGTAVPGFIIFFLAPDADGIIYGKIFIIAAYAILFFLWTVFNPGRSYLLTEEGFYKGKKRIGTPIRFKELIGAEEDYTNITINGVYHRRYMLKVYNNRNRCVLTLSEETQTNVEYAFAALIKHNIITMKDIQNMASYEKTMIILDNQEI